MRTFPCAVLTAIFAFSTFAAADMATGPTTNTNDICSTRPDLCGTKARRTKKKRVRPPSAAISDYEAYQHQKKSKRKPARTGADVNDEASNDFFSRDREETQLQPLPQRSRAQNPVNSRNPAAISPAPIAAPSSTRRRISFTNYLTANSSHPSLSTKRSARQDAFQAIARPSILTAPGSESNGDVGTKETTAGGASPAAAPAASPSTPSSPSSSAASGSEPFAGSASGDQNY